MTSMKGNKHGRAYKRNGERLSKRPTLGKLKKKAWSVLSEFIRRSYADQGGTVECYTCGKLMFWKECHAGHAIPGRHGAVLLDPEIIRPQCPVDNIWRGGCYEVFATKLIRENGLEWFERKLENSRQVRKWNRSELEEFIETYKNKLMELEETVET